MDLAPGEVGVRVVWEPWIKPKGLSWIFLTFSEKHSLAPTSDGQPGSPNPSKLPCHCAPAGWFLMGQKYKNWCLSGGRGQSQAQGVGPVTLVGGTTSPPFATTCSLKSVTNWADLFFYQYFYQTTVISTYYFKRYHFQKMWPSPCFPMDNPSLSCFMFFSLLEFWDPVFSSLESLNKVPHSLCRNPVPPGIRTPRLTLPVLLQAPGSPAPPGLLLLMTYGIPDVLPPKSWQDKMLAGTGLSGSVFLQSTQDYDNSHM